MNVGRQRVLVTGAGGFVGSEIVRHLVRENRDVFAIGSAANQRRGQGSEIFSETRRDFAVDITKREDVETLTEIKSIDAFVHCAGLAHQFGETSRERFQLVNVEGTANVLKIAKRLEAKHFILISSVAVYGDAKKRRETEGSRAIDETSACAPTDFYAASKLDGEKLSLEFCASNNIKLTILRLATVIGEEDKGNFLRLIRQIDRRRFVWIGNGANRKSFVHREDVARACAVVLDEKDEMRSAEIFNVSAESVSIRETVEIVSRTLNRKIPNFSVPAPFVKKIFRLNAATFNSKKIARLEKTIDKWLADDVYSAEKIKRKHGFEPQISAEKAIVREVVWYKANNNAKE